jgi:hypothetical protein
MTLSYPEYITAIQSILGEYMPNEQVLTAEAADRLGERLLKKLDLLNPGEPKAGHHQTVMVSRQNNQWIPVTLHFRTDAEGRINYVRIHTNRFIREYGQL